MSQQGFRVEWDAHEYEHKEKTPDWFWAVGIISASIAITAVILGNIIFAVLVVVAVFSLLVFANRPPDTLRVVIDEQGIKRDKVLYPYSTLKSFWIDTDHPHKKIILHSEKLLMPLIVVPLSDSIDAEELHDNLSQFLPEEFHELPFIERVIDYLGF